MAADFSLSAPDTHALANVIQEFASPALFSAETRLYDIEIEGYAGRFVLEAFSGVEALSQLYEYRVDLLSTDALIDPRALLGRRVCLGLRLADGTRQVRSGYVARAAQPGSDGGLARYRLSVVPWLWIATQEVKSRVFEEQRFTELIDTVLGRYAEHANWRYTPELAGFLAGARSRSYCVQYRESDYAFLSRLLAEEGLGFYFEEVGNAASDGTSGAGTCASPHRLVIFADSTALPEDLSSAQAGGIRYHRTGSQEARDTIQTFGRLHTLQPAQSVLAGWDYKAKRVIRAEVSSAQPVGGPHPPNAPQIEHYDWAGQYPFNDSAQAQRYATLSREAFEARAQHHFGQGSVRTLRPGTRYTLIDSPLEQLSSTPASVSASRSVSASTPDPRQQLVIATRVAGRNNLPAALAAHAQALADEVDETNDTFPGFDTARDSVSNTSFDSARFPLPAVHLGLTSLEDYLNDRQAETSLREAARAHGYALRFVCLPAARPWRPALEDGSGQRLHPRPTAKGPQTAIVIGPADGSRREGEVYTDALGRIRIRYPWQADAANGANASCWVRCAQLAAGAGFGAQFIPRIGQEVLIKFIDNNVERPMAMGTLYNGRGEGGQSALSRNPSTHPPTPGPAPARGAGSKKADSAYDLAADHTFGGQGNLVASGSGGHSPAWHGDAPAHGHSGALSGIKSTALGAGGPGAPCNELVFDDTDGQLRTRLASHTGASSLNLGHLIHQADNYRGSVRGAGFEARTDAYGAIRAGRGLLISTYPGVAAGGAPEGTPDAAGEFAGGAALLKQALGIAQAFDRATATHRTVRLACVAFQQSTLDEAQAALPAWVKTAGAQVSAKAEAIETSGAANGAASGETNNKAGGRATDAASVPHPDAPILAVAARGGLSVTTADSLQWANGEHYTQMSGKDTGITVTEALTIHSGKAIGLLARANAGATGGETTHGYQLIAGAGPIDLQAQSDTLQALASELIHVASAKANVDFAAAKSIILTVQGGAYMKMEGGNIEFGCPGTITVHAAQKSFTGPTTLSREMNTWPTSSFDDAFVLRNPSTGEPLANRLVEITRGDGSKIKVMTDASGKTPVQKSQFIEAIKIQPLD